ncbi:MAG: hypothetical protein HY754_14030 [Nitrospirae bacterium]|nr:hypothetical protein [Nitrospirota bacterium]
MISLLNNALDAKNNGNDQESDNIMQAFINQVETLSGKQISESAANILINAANYVVNS